MDTIDNEIIDSLFIELQTIKQLVSGTDSGCCNYWLIILLIVITGLMSGFVNYLSINRDEDRNRRNLYYSILLSLIGSSLVPLFLELTNSKLLKECNECTVTYFVIGGYMLIASIFASRLIAQLGKKIFDINDVQNIIDRNQTEPESTTDLPQNDIDDIQSNIEKENKSESFSKEQAIKDTNTLLANMQGSRFKYRTISGLAKTTQIDKDTVFTIIKTLELKSIVKERIRNGKSYYYLTKRGLSLRLIAKPK